MTAKGNGAKEDPDIDLTVVLKIRSRFRAANSVCTSNCEAPQTVGRLTGSLREALVKIACQIWALLKLELRCKCSASYTVGHRHSKMGVCLFVGGRGPLD